MSNLCLYCLKQELATIYGICNSCISQNNIHKIICMGCSNLRICVFNGICKTCIDNEIYVYTPSESMI